MSNEIAEIAPAMRKDHRGEPVSDSMLKRIVATKISRPTASNKLIAQLTGIHRNTVSSALQTDYAKMALSDIGDLVLEAKKIVVETVGDSAQLVQDIVTTGIKEMTRSRKTMSPFLISNAKDCALQVLKNTILPDQLTVRNSLHSPDAFSDVDNSELLARYKQLTEVGEGETGDHGEPVGEGGSILSKPDESPLIQLDESTESNQDSDS